MHKYIRSVLSIFVYGNVRGFFPPLVWTESIREDPIPLEYPSMSDCKYEHYASITMMDVLDMLVPHKEVAFGSVKMSLNPLAIFSGVPRTEAILALKAFLGFRKIDVPGKDKLQFLT